MSAGRRGNSRSRTSRTRLALSQLLSGTSLVHAVSLAASLGIADLLESGPQTPRSLAQQTATDEDSLYRLLRALSAAGVFAQNGRRFALTPISRLLRTGAPDSMRSLAALAGARCRRAAFGLSYSVRTGKPAFEQEFRRSFYDYLAANRRERRLFSDVMAYTWRTMGADILAGYDSEGAQTIVDVGGGAGAMMEAILHTNRAAGGVIVEASQVVRETRRRIRLAGLESRCRVVGADFRDGVPGGGDLYVLAFVLHNWGDEQSVAILQNCRRSMSPGGRLLVIESPLDASPFAAIHDLEMLLYMPGGRERTIREYRRLLDSAGLAVRRIIPTRTTARLIEATAARRRSARA